MLRAPTLTVRPYRTDLCTLKHTRQIVVFIRSFCIVPILNIAQNRKILPCQRCVRLLGTSCDYLKRYKYFLRTFFLKVPKLQNVLSDFCTACKFANRIISLSAL